MVQTFHYMLIHCDIIYCFNLLLTVCCAGMIIDSIAMTQYILSLSEYDIALFVSKASSFTITKYIIALQATYLSATLADRAHIVKALMTVDHIGSKCHHPPPAKPLQ